MTNTAEGSGTDSNGDPVTDSDTNTVDITQDPAHTLTKTFDPNPIGVGDTGTLIGSTETQGQEAQLFYGDQLVDDSLYSVEGRNQDIFFNPPEVNGVDDEGFRLHLSCSEIYIDGWGTTGPTEEDNPDWQIAAYEVNRYNVNGFFRDCGQTFAPFDVDHSAKASATPAGGEFDEAENPVVASDTVQVINPAPTEVSRNRLRRGDVEIQYFNTSFADLEIDIIQVEWAEDGVDLELSGDSPQVANTNTLIPDRSKDWLKLSFSNNKVPTGLKVTITTSTGSMLIYEYGS